MTDTVQNTSAQSASNAVLVGLSIRTWSANTMDQSVSQKVASEHGTDRKMGRFWKTLVARNKGTALGHIYATEREARKFHYENTMGWMIDGIRILPVANFSAYNAKMNEYKAQLERQVIAFLDQYEDIKASAKEQLKTLYTEEDYPSRDRLARSFSLEVNVMPLPKSSTFFETELSDVERERAKRALESDLVNTFKRANEELHDRLYACVAKLQERLSGDEKYLRETAIDNAKELLNLLPRLNISNDPRLESLRSELDQAFEGMTAEALRRDVVLRNQKLDKVNEIEALMSTFMGGMPMGAMNAA